MSVNWRTLYYREQAETWSSLLNKDRITLVAEMEHTVRNPRPLAPEAAFTVRHLDVCAVDSEAISNYHQLRLSQQQRMHVVTEGTNGEAAVIIQK